MTGRGAELVDGVGVRSEVAHEVARVATPVFVIAVTVADRLGAPEDLDVRIPNADLLERGGESRLREAALAREWHLADVDEVLDPLGLEARDERLDCLSFVADRVNRQGSLQRPARHCACGCPV